MLVTHLGAITPMSGGCWPKQGNPLLIVKVQIGLRWTFLVHCIFS